MEERLTKKERRELKRRERADQAVVEQSKKRFWRNVYVIAAVFIVVFIIIVVRALLAKNIEAVANIGNDPIIGNPGAKVIIREYSDFQCPACRTSALALERVVGEYAADELAYIYNDFPIIQLHPNAYEAALAAQCAHEQEKFWEYHNRLFLDQDGWKGLENPRDKFVAYADALDLDTEQFGVCLDDQKYKHLVDEDLNEARELNMNSTPTYFINGIRQVGAKSEQGWRDLINSLLGK